MTKWDIRFVSGVSLAAVTLIGVAGWMLYPRTGTAEAAVREACAQITDVQSYDYTVTLGPSPHSVTTEYQVSGNRFYAKLTVEGAPGYLEAISDGAGTEWVRSHEQELWDKHERDPIPVPDFPERLEDLCPAIGIGDFSYLKDDTFEGVSARQYSVDVGDLGWHVWVDAEGWLVGAEQTKVDGVSGDGVPSVTTTLVAVSGIGEPNVIELPDASQTVSGIGEPNEIPSITVPGWKAGTPQCDPFDIPTDLVVSTTIEGESLGTTLVETRYSGSDYHAIGRDADGNILYEAMRAGDAVYERHAEGAWTQPDLPELAEAMAQLVGKTETPYGQRGPGPCPDLTLGAFMKDTTLDGQSARLFGFDHLLVWVDDGGNAIQAKRRVERVGEAGNPELLGTITYAYTAVGEPNAIEAPADATAVCFSAELVWVECERAQDAKDSP